MSVKLTEEQQKIHDKLLSWMDNISWDDPAGGGNNREALVGYAGTGKTTLLGALASSLESTIFMGRRKIAFCAYTGKATSVLRRKLQASSLNPESYDCGTIHSLFFTTDRCADSNNDAKFFLKDPVLICDKYCLVIIDEASMLGQDMYNMMRNIDIPILLVGDPGQLPPVNQESPKLLLNSTNRLETVHRQAMDNPIIKIATKVRQGADIDEFNGSDVKKKLFINVGTHEKMVAARTAFIKAAYKKENIILCGKNATRVRMNKQVRAQYPNFGELPEFGEKLVNLANNRDLNMMNGQMFYVYSSKRVSDVFYELHLIREENWEGPDKDDYDNGPMLYVLADNSTLNNPDASTYMSERFHDFHYKSEFSYRNESEDYGNNSPMFFDYGYCLSVHKSQGSEWRSVFFLNDKLFKKTDKKAYHRWLYTGITRASEQLILEV